MTTEQRLAKLERQNLQLKWAIAALVATAISGCMMNLDLSRKAMPPPPKQVSVPDVIQAQRFEVVDTEGRPTVTLACNQDGTGGVVFVNNDSGVLVAQMGAADDRRGVIWTYDPQGCLQDDNR